MTERHNAKPARAGSLRLLGINRGLLLAACAVGSFVGAQACGSSDSDSGGAGTAGAHVAGANGAGAPGAGGANGGANPGGAGAPSPNAGAGGAGAGATGNAGAAGASTAGAAGANSAGAGGGMPMAEGDNVVERNHHASRDGLFVQPKLTKAVIPTLTADAGFSANFDGDMWSSPVYITNGPGGKGAFFTVTPDNNVYALDETTGATLWKKNIGSAPQNTGVPCGQIHPLGILSTPVIDPVSRTIYVAGAIGTDNIAKHEVHALNIDDGSERAGWPVDVTGIKSPDNITFLAPPQNQRSALSLVNGKLYVAYGGHIGDCGLYHGWVIAIDTANPTSKGAWATLGQGEAIWAAGGLASDGTSIFAVTGNSTVGAGARAASDSEEVVRLTGLSVLARSDKNLYYPTSWKTMDDQDADFGASNPIYLTLPGSTPSNVIAAVAKDGNFYLLNASNLGGMGGHLLTVPVSVGAMSVKTSPTAYTTAKGTHFVLGTEGQAKCPGGNASGKSMISVLITAGSPPKAAVEWCSPLSGESAAPIATSSDGTSNAAVWYMSNGKLMAVDGDTGTMLYTSTSSCSNVRRWTSPIAVKGRIVVGGDGHLCSWSAH